MIEERSSAVWSGILSGALSAVIVERLWRFYLRPFLRGSSRKDRIHHISLLAICSLALSLTLWSGSILIAHAQSRRTSIGQVREEFDHDRVVENGIQIETLRDDYRRVMDVIEQLKQANVKLEDRVQKQDRQISQAQGALTGLTVFFGLILTILSCITAWYTIRKNSERYRENEEHIS